MLLSTEEKRMTFEEWKAAIDVILLKVWGCTQDDLPDWLARDAYDEGVTPEQAADQLIYENRDEDDYDDSMDGDTASALASVGWGTDEDYGVF
jgi:hypothetical protein